MDLLLCFITAAILVTVHVADQSRRASLALDLFYENEYK